MRVRTLALLVVAAATLSAPAAQGASIAKGRALFVDGCSTCHGLAARGVPGVAPDLHGVGALAADFYLTSGRMPLDNPGTEPERGPPAYPPEQIDDLVAYIGSLGGPPVPRVDLSQGKINEGLKAFTAHCAGCHQVVARGGAITGGFAPSLRDATPTQIAEAVRLGPFVMPTFNENEISDQTLASIILYVKSTNHPDNRGGWGIFEIGPVPEGMVAWLIAGAVLILVARLIGERNRE
jgi:ubiquinol-cytochrome c reductase cytochrome c subunit